MIFLKMEPVKCSIIEKMEKSNLKENMNKVMEYKFFMMIMAQKLLKVKLKMENLIKENLLFTMMMEKLDQELNLKKEKLQLNNDEFKT